MSRIVNGTGNPNATLMLVGEGPGREEAAVGLPFVGRSGQLLWQMLDHHTGLSREDVWVDNLVKERCTKRTKAGVEEDAPPPPAMVAKWGPDLLANIRTVKPKIIMTLGRYSTRYLLQQSGYTFDYANAVTMQVGHGRAYAVPVGMLSDRECWIVPAFHPAAGLHQPEFLKYTDWDLSQLQDAQEAAVDEHPEPQYKLLRNVSAKR